MSIAKIKLRYSANKNPSISLQAVSTVYTPLEVRWQLAKDTGCCGHCQGRLWVPQVKRHGVPPWELLSLSKGSCEEGISKNWSGCPLPGRSAVSLGFFGHLFEGTGVYQSPSILTFAYWRFSGADSLIIAQTWHPSLKQNHTQKIEANETTVLSLYYL